MAAPHPARRGRCTRGAGAPRPRQGPARPARCRLTADRRRPGRRKRNGPIRGRPGEDGGANQGGGVPPPSPPPPAALAHRRPTGPRPTPAAARQPPGHEYTPETTDGRPTPNRAGGAGGRPPHAPTAPPLPAWRPQERPSAPPEPRGPPPPRMDRDAGGGVAAGPAHRAPQRPTAPGPAGVAAAERAITSVPEQRAHQAWGRRTAAHQNSMEAAPYMTLP